MASNKSAEMKKGGEVKRKHVVLSIADKLKIIEKIAFGVTIGLLAADHGIGVTTVKDIKKNKESMRKFAMKFDFDTRAGKRQDKRERHLGEH
jgi:hypothetical protein